MDSAAASMAAKPSNNASRICTANCPRMSCSTTSAYLTYAAASPAKCTPNADRSKPKRPAREAARAAELAAKPNPMDQVRALIKAIDARDERLRTAGMLDPTMSAYEQSAAADDQATRERKRTIPSTK